MYQHGVQRQFSYKTLFFMLRFGSVLRCKVVVIETEHSNLHIALTYNNNT